MGLGNNRLPGTGWAAVEIACGIAGGFSGGTTLARRQGGGRAEGEDLGPYEEGARAVRLLFGESSNRALERKTAVNFTSIGSMRLGRAASAENTIKVARAYRVNPNRLLQAFGHDPIPELDLISWENDAKYFPGQPRVAAPGGARLAPPASAARDNVLLEAGMASAEASAEDLVLMVLGLYVREGGAGGALRPLRPEDLSPQIRADLMDRVRRGEFLPDAVDSDAAPAGTEDEGGRGVGPAGD